MPLPVEDALPCQDAIARDQVVDQLARRINLGSHPKWAQHQRASHNRTKVPSSH